VQTTPEQIDLLRAAPSEHQRLEFKEAKNQYDTGKLSEYCVAIANEGGGKLLLGIGDKPPRPVTGSNAFPDVIDIAGKLFTWVGFRVDVEEVTHPDGRVVVFRIPARPRGTAYHFKGKYLMRSGEELVPMSEDRLRNIFAEGQPDWLEEPSKRNLTGQEVIDLLDTQTYFDLRGLTYPTNQDGVLDRLKQDRLIDEEPQTGWVIKRMGGLLIAKRLTDFADLARKAPRMVVYKGVSKLHTKLDQVSDRGYAVGFRSLVQLVMTQLPQNEVIKGAIRQEHKLVPEIVMRELVANALIHQDFSQGGSSVMIEVYDNRIEVSNPGEPVVPVERFIDGYQSRNESLADLMRRLGICEEKSSGIDQVVDAVEAYQLPAPEFTTTHGRTVAIVHGHLSFAYMSGADRVRASYQHAALKCVMREPMTNSTLRQRFGLGEERTTVVSQVIAAAIASGLIKPDASAGGSKRLARYLPFWG
jgi:predicted HTH transcriptional regulator